MSCMWPEINKDTVLFCSEKAAILPVVLAASKSFFFEANVLHSQTGILVNARA